MKQKQVVYYNQEESEKLRPILLSKKQKLEEKLVQVRKDYLEEGKKCEEKKYRGIHHLQALSNRERHLEAQIQKKEVEVSHLDSLTFEKKNFFQKILGLYQNLSYKQQKVICGVVLLLPWFLGFCIFFAKPLITTMVWSLYEVTPQAGYLSMDFVGFKNFVDLFTVQMLGNRTFLEVLSVSIESMIIDVPVIFIFSLLVAVVLNTKFKGHQIFKAIFFIPVVYNASAIAAALDGSFGGHMSSSMSSMANLMDGFSNYLLNLGLAKGLITFLIGAVDRIFTIVNRSGIQILIFIAALQSIPNQLYEAAKVEGATTYECFWKITFPMVSNMFLPIIIYTIVDSFATSDLIQFMTVNSSGARMAYGMASAIAIIYFAVNFLIIGILFLVLRKVVYQND
jgi:ABC-type sugar transport system permease subunit